MKIDENTRKPKPNLTGQLEEWYTYNDIEESPYDLVDIIGEGAYGKVYKGYDRNNHMYVAIKKLQIPRTQKKLKSIENEINFLLKIPNQEKIIRIDANEYTSLLKSFFKDCYITI